MMNTLIMKFALLGLGTSLLGSCSNGKGPDIPFNGDVATGTPQPSEGEQIPDGTAGADGSGQAPVDTAPPIPATNPGTPPLDGSGGVVNNGPQPEPPAPTPPVSPPPVTPAPTPAFFADCLEHKKANPAAETGEYQIFLDATAASPQRSLTVFCDMDVDGGGWTMFLNYEHKGGTNPQLNVKNNTFPVRGTLDLGVDESAFTRFWGHASNAMLANFPIKELRFFCKTNAVTQVLNFKTSDPSCIAHAKTGTGTCLNIKNSFTRLTSHTSLLPETLTNAGSNKGNNAMTDDVFSQVINGDPNPPDPTWSIRGGANLAWECGFGSNNASFDTIHRMYFR